MDAQQIYDNFHGHAQGTGGLGVGQEAAQQLAANSQNRAAEIQQLISGIQAGWTGSAADAAAQGLVPYSLNELGTQDGLVASQSVIEQQMNSFQTAAAEVQPVPPALQPQNIVSAVLAGQDVEPMYQQLDTHYVAQTLNVYAYNKYVGASQDNTTGLPTVVPVEVSDAPVSVSTEPASAAPAGASTGASMVHSGRRVGYANAEPVAAAGTSPATNPAGSTGQPVPASPGSSSTAPSSDPPGPTVPPGQNPPVGPAPGRPASPPPPVAPVGPATGVTPVSAEPLPTTPATGLGSQQPEEPESGSGSGAVGFVGVVEPDPWLASGGQAPQGRPAINGRGGNTEVGPRSGVDAEVVSQGESLGSGTSGVRTSALAEAGPLGSARRGTGDEDDEYTSKYLDEEDGDDLFGVPTATVPAVIGESVMERTRRRNMAE